MSRWQGRHQGRDEHAGDRIERLRFALLFALAMLLPTLIALALLGLIGGDGSPPILVVMGLVLALLFLIGRGASAGFDGIGTRFSRLLIAQGGDPVPRGYSEQEALIVAGRAREAADSYRALLVAYPDDVDARIRLAALLERLGERDEALAAYAAARAARPAPALALRISTGLADLHRRAGQGEALREELARCARDFPGTASGEAARRELAGS